jgi:predicted unusual protein kinase regulating ubiquinone biosynthesis (AarF/ABC1/UbiB family)
MEAVSMLCSHVQLCMQVSTDWVGLIDEWAQRFFHELDYDREARNAIQFKQQMEHLGGITVAPVYSELTSSEVLTTAWVQGKRRSRFAPVARAHSHDDFPEQPCQSISNPVEAMRA